MCGICGFNWEDEKLLKRAASTIRHRGPDDDGYYAADGISLGQLRLSIIDLEKGLYPVHNEEKTVQLVYNGEIYNFKEIRKELEKKGHKFYSNCDSEVIVHAYEEYGFDCVKLFNGMFAFALWDSKKKRLFLARDRVGIKPLYYYFKDGKFIFASEIKAILECGVESELNEKTFVDYVTFQNIPDDNSFFNGVKMLLPAHYLVLKGKKPEITCYWDTDFSKEKLSSVDSYLEKFRGIFKNAVKRHLISDVPLGSYLSGGFDSSSVAEMASELIEGRLSTFTGNFREGGQYDETPCSNALSEQINAKTYTTTITPSDFIEGIHKVVYHMDEPKAGMPGISQYYVSKLVAEHVKVVLTGHAGDELFSGYPVYKAMYFKDLVKRNPLNWLRLFTFFKLSEMPRSFYFLFYPLFVPEIKYGMFMLFSRRQRKRLFTSEFQEKIKGYEPTDKLKKFWRKGLSAFDSVQNLYLKMYLPSLLLVEDKMGMAHSIEARTPICDNEMVDLAVSLPMEKKMHKGELKFIIKEGMKDKLPEIFYRQTKKGFPTPLSLWFKGELKEFAYDLLLDERTTQRGIFNKDYVKKLLDKHCRSKTDTTFDLLNAARLWSLINIEIWFRLFIDKDKELLSKVKKKS